MADIYFWRQCFILVTTLLQSLSMGFMHGYPAVLNAALLSANTTDITTTADHASWITASNGLTGIIGALTFAPILSNFGRKAGLVVVTIALLVGWLIFPLATNISALYAARMIQALSSGGSYMIIMVVSEYIHPSRRGYFITLKKVAIASGSLCCHAMQPFWSWRQISVFVAVATALSIIMTMLWPESPSYLALNGKLVECEKSFKWLNGNSEKSQKYLKILIDSQIGKSERKRGPRFQQFLKTFTERDFLKSMMIVCLLTIALDLCGRYYLIAYVTEIMMKLLGDKTAAVYFTLGADSLTVVALAASSVVVKYLKRRTILYSFGFGSVLLMLTISLFAYLDVVYKLSCGLMWLTAFLVILLCFVSNLGLIPVSFAIISEIIPLEHKGTGFAVTGVVFTSFLALSLKLTPVLIINTGLYGTFGIYGITLIVCFFLLMKVLPETKDKPLHEIEDELKGVLKCGLTRTVESSTLIQNVYPRPR